MRSLHAVTFSTIIAVRAASADADPPSPFTPDHEGPSIVIAGPIEVVFDWTTDRCNDEQIPDLPVRAFRDTDGEVVLILAHTESYAMRGPDFDNLRIDCTPLLSSSRESDPSLFSDGEWLAAVYASLDGSVHALIHNEYQGNRHPTGCASREYFRCWYNSITAAMSFDGGRTFEHARPPPDHLVASITDPYMPDGGIFGAFSPSNIVAHDGHLYAFLKLQTPPFGDQHSCLMRTDDIADPDAWRFWTGVGFSGVFPDPWRDDLRAMRATECAPVSLGEIAQMYESLTLNTELDQFILIGTSSDPTREPNPFGFFYAFSADLTTWSDRQPLMEVRLPWRATGSETVYLYPSLIDHGSVSRNFETTDGTAHLYFTRLNFGSGHLDRDLLRVPVEIRPAR